MAFDSWGASWGGAFTRFVRWGAFEQATVPTFGPPFLDRRSPLLMTLGASSPVITAIGLRSQISPHIELEDHLPSFRIDRALS